MKNRQNASTQLHELFAEEWEFRLQENPIAATLAGDHRYDDRLPSAIEADFERRYRQNQAFLSRLTAIGDISRFPDANHLVGYAGLWARVHDSGLTSHSGGITKAGRREMRAVLVEAAQVGVLHDPRWKAELARLEPRLGRNKAIVAVVRKMLVIVWHILSKHEADQKINLERLARKYYEFAYTVGKANWGECKSAVEFIRLLLDRAGVGREQENARLGAVTPLVDQRASAITIPAVFKRQ